MKDQIVWVDMPVLDLARAAKFYQAVLADKVEVQEFDGMQFGVLPHAQTNVSGCLVPSKASDIIRGGVLIYFNVEQGLTAAIHAVKENGGSVEQDKHAIGPHGFRAIVIDSEGNRIALHSRVDN